jgi:hypothetical protein
VLSFYAHSPKARERSSPLIPANDLQEPLQAIRSWLNHCTNRRGRGRPGSLYPFPRLPLTENRELIAPRKSCFPRENAILRFSKPRKTRKQTSLTAGNNFPGNEKHRKTRSISGFARWQPAARLAETTSSKGKKEMPEKKIVSLIVLFSPSSLLPQECAFLRSSPQNKYRKGQNVEFFENVEQNYATNDVPTCRERRSKRFPRRIKEENVQ